MEAVDLATVEVSDEVLAMVSPTVADIYEVLPLRFENGGRDLVIATAAPDRLDTLTDLGFILSRRIVAVRADRDAILAAIKRHYGTLSLPWLREAADEMRALDSRGVVARAGARLRRALARCRDGVLELLGRHVTGGDYPPHERFAYQALLAVAESGAREGTVECSSARGRFRFRFVDAGGAPVEYDIPPRWARRIIRRLARMAKGSPRHGVPEGRLRLWVGDKVLDYEVGRERTADGERIVLRIVDHVSAAS